MPLQDKDGGRDKPAADLLRRSLASSAGAAGSDIGACPDPEILAAYSERSLDAEETERYELHLSQCARCREQLAAMAHAGELAGAAGEKRARTSGAAWNWDWRWLAPAAAALVFAAIVVTFRPLLHPAGQSSQPLVAMNQPTAPPAAPSAEAIAKLGPAPAPAASAPAPALSRSRTAPNLNSDKPEIAPPSKPLPERKEFGATATLGARDYSHADMEAKTAPAPQAEVSSRMGNVAGNRMGTGTGSANGVGTAGGIAAAPPRATQTVTVESEVSPVPTAAPASAEKKTAQANGAVSASDTVTQQTTSGQQMSVVVANRNLTANESVMVQANDATSAQTVVHSPDPQVLWRFSGGRFVERSSDAGVTWHVQWTNANAHLVAGVAPSGNSCWLVGRAGLVLVTVNGKKWKQVAPPANADFVDVAATDASSAIVTSADGRKFTTSDRGNHWSPAP
jgi:hypothetical protein